MRLLAPDSEESCLKMLQSLAADDYLCVWEGAVRSGKTVIALTAFAKYVLECPGTNFLLSGRTVTTIKENAVLGEFGLLNLIPGAEPRHVGQAEKIIFTVPSKDGGRVRKSIMIVGASDIRAYMKIRGNSYDGWFADEVNVQDREFVIEAMKRTGASKCRRHFWTLNPDNPRHWLYREYLDRYEAMSDPEKADLGGFRLWRFYLPDNPVMTPAMVASVKAMYPLGSMQYRRYILGERCIAEGLVYPYVGECVGDPPEGLKARYAGIDFGTVHPTAMGWYGRDPETGTWWKVREWVASPEESARMTNDQYMDVFEAVCEELGGIPRMNLTIDPGGGGESLVREAQRRRWMPQSPDKSVLDGIGVTARLLNTARLKIGRRCVKTIEAMSNYHWDERASARGDTAPAKVDDDPCDETRYVCTTFIEPRISRA